MMMIYTPSVRAKNKVGIEGNKKKWHQRTISLLVIVIMLQLNQIFVFEVCLPLE